MLCIQFGEDGSHQSFLVELQWSDNYPEEPATINLDLFYNKHMWAVLSLMFSWFSNKQASYFDEALSNQLFIH